MFYDLATDHGDSFLLVVSAVYSDFLPKKTFFDSDIKCPKSESIRMNFHCVYFVN